MEKLLDLLMGFDSSFSTVHSQLMNAKPLTSVGSAYSVLCQEEKQQSVAAGTMVVPEATVLAAKTVANTASPNGARSRRTNHFTCAHCKKQGHSKERCFEFICYPLGWKNKGQANPNLGPVAAVADTDPLGDSSSPVSGLSTTQYQQLLSLLGPSSSSPCVNLTGPTLEEADWSG